MKSSRVSLILSAILTLAVVLGYQNCGSGRMVAGKVSCVTADCQSSAGTADPSPGKTSSTTETSTSTSTSQVQNFLNADAVIQTNLGTFRIHLYRDLAPITVQNFIDLAEGNKAWTDPRTGQSMTGVPFYNGLIFHRVVMDFVIQGGCPLGTGQSGPGYYLPSEIHPTLAHDRPGIVAMAKNSMGTSGSQFYITLAPEPQLDGQYNIFGEVTQGMEVVNSISHVAVGSNYRPIVPVVMNSVTIQRY